MTIFRAGVIVRLRVEFDRLFDVCGEVGLRACRPQRRGDQLPRIRDVVTSLSINPNTVLKAYRDLEQKGLIGARPGLGTFVEAAPETVGLSELTTLRRSLVTGWLREAAATGLDEDGIVALFASALGDFRKRPDEHRLTTRQSRVASGATGGAA